MRILDPLSCAPGGPGMTNCEPCRESCCTSLRVPGGTFDRSYDAVFFKDPHHPATISELRIDKYEITVGRFRQFVAAVVGGWRPARGSGKHAYLNAGKGLEATSGGYEPGWDPAWTGALPQTSADWQAAFGTGGTWTEAPGANESLPISDVAWSDVYAFCIWDGGFLPSEAEWNFAAAGGGSSTGQRVFPWSRPPTDTTANCTLANYQNGNSTSCFPEGVNDVGSESPAGDDAFGQSDMAGNIYEWVLDWSADYVTPCDDCVSVPAVEDVLGAVPGRVFRGGGAAGVKSRMLTSYRFAAPADSRISYVGARCARAP